LINTTTINPKCEASYLYFKQAHPSASYRRSSCFPQTRTIRSLVLLKLFRNYHTAVFLPLFKALLYAQPCSTLVERDLPHENSCMLRNRAKSYGSFIVVAHRQSSCTIGEKPLHVCELCYAITISNPICSNTDLFPTALATF